MKPIAIAAYRLYWATSFRCLVKNLVVTVEDVPEGWAWSVRERTRRPPTEQWKPGRRREGLIAAGEGALDAAKKAAIGSCAELLCWDQRYDGLTMPRGYFLEVGKGLRGLFWRVSRTADGKQLGHGHANSLGHGRELAEAALRAYLEAAAGAGCGDART